MTRAEETNLTPAGYVLAVANLAQQWPARGGGCIGYTPAFLPVTDDSETRASHAIGMADVQASKAEAWKAHGVDWPYLSDLLRPAQGVAR